MAKYTTRKATSRGKQQTIARRAQRATKYTAAARVTAAGRAR